MPTTSVLPAVLAVLAMGRSRPSPLDQAGVQLRAVLGLNRQQRALLGSVARRRCGALAEIADAEIGRLARGDTFRTIRGELRGGPVVLAAAASAVASEVDVLLSPEQRVALERFEPRLTLSRGARRCARQLAEACRRSAGSGAATPEDPEVDGLVAEGVEAVLCEMGVSVRIAAAVGERVTRLLDRPAEAAEPSLRQQTLALVAEVADEASGDGAGLVKLLLKWGVELRLAPAGGDGRRRRWLWNLTALTPLVLGQDERAGETSPRPRTADEKEETTCDV